jgi:hypothetical protein
MFIAIARPGVACRGVSETLIREGRGECYGYSEVPVW